MNILWEVIAPNLLTIIFGLSATQISEPSNIRGLHGPIVPDGIPPFTVTAIVIVTAVGVLLRSKVVFNRSRRMPGQTRKTVEYTPETLLHEYEQCNMTIMQLFERLATMLRTHLVPDDNLALTNAEIEKIARSALSPDTLKRVTVLLVLCDKVRFGAYHPPEALIRKSLEEARSILDEPAGTNG